MRQVAWQEVSELVKKANISLWKLINDINPGPELPLFLAKYHYGDLIVNEGVVQFPLQKDAVVAFQGLPDETKKFFNQDLLPIGLVLNKAIEVFSHCEDRAISLNILKAGQLLGLCALRSPAPFNFTQINVSAGARNTFLLPNVSDITHHKKLVNIYNAPQMVNSIFDHWAVFKKIANYRFQNRYWNCDLLFFSKGWLEKVKQADTVPWLLLKNYFYEQGCVDSSGLFHLFNNIYLKNYLLKVISKCRINISDYAFDTFKYLFLMQQGQVPGFQISDGEEQYLPERAIQQAYIDDYKLKTYLPIIMHSAIWEDENRLHPLYYSLNLPIIFSGTMPDMKNVRRTDLLQQINLVIEELKLTDHCRYRYLHHHADSAHGIERAAHVLGSDPRVIRLKEIYPDRDISSSNTFVRGCIQLQKVITDI